MNHKKWDNWPRVLLGIGLSLGSAILFTLAFPPFEMWPFIFLGLVPVIVVQHRVMPARFSGLAYGLGIGGFFAGYFDGIFIRGPWYMQGLPLFIALMAGLVGSRDRAFHRRTDYRWFLLQGPLVWVGIELIRGVIPTVGTWGFTSYALYRQPWLIQPVSLFGIYGLSFLILVINYLIASLLLTWIDQRDFIGLGQPGFHFSNLFPGTKWVGVVLLAWLGTSLVMFYRPEEGTNSSLKAAAVHPAFRVVSQKGVERLIEHIRNAVNQGRKWWRFRLLTGNTLRASIIHIWYSGQWKTGFPSSKLMWDLIQPSLIPGEGSWRGL